METFIFCAVQLFHDGRSYQSKSMEWFLYDRDTSVLKELMAASQIFNTIFNPPLL